MCCNKIQEPDSTFGTRENININVVEAENGYVISGYSHMGRSIQYVCPNRGDLDSFINVLVQDLLKKE